MLTLNKCFIDSTMNIATTISIAITIIAINTTSILNFNRLTKHKFDKVFRKVFLQLTDANLATLLDAAPQVLHFILSVFLR